MKSTLHFRILATHLAARQMSRDTLTPSELFVHLRGVLFASLPCLALFGVLYSAAQIPQFRPHRSASPRMQGFDLDQPDFDAPTDISKIGKRSSRPEQKPLPFRTYVGVEYENFTIPPDAGEKSEWLVARLMYRGMRWGNWTVDYPRSDRHLASAVRRLSRIDARSVEQPVALEDADDVYNYPWLYAVEVGHWYLTDFEAAKLRDYLLRGGFLMVDDFHGTWEWAAFVEGMKKVFPDRPIVDIPNDDAIFHTVYDLDDRYQIPGEQFLYTGRTYERDGYEAHWRGIYDDKGRLMVAICHDMDLGDSWEHADDPEYPEKYSALAFRIGVDYVTYAMTH